MIDGDFQNTEWEPWDLPEGFELLTEDEVEALFPAMIRMKSDLLQLYNVTVEMEFATDHANLTRWRLRWLGEPEVVEFLSKIYYETLQAMCKTEKVREISAPSLTEFDKLDPDIWGDLSEYDPSMPEED